MAARAMPQTPRVSSWLWAMRQRSACGKESTHWRFGDGRQDVLHQVLGLVGHLSAHATRAECALFAAEGHEAALGAVVAAEAGEAVPEDAAAQVAAQGVDHEAGQWALSAGFQVLLQLVAEELVQRACAWIPTLVGEREGRRCSDGSGGHPRG
jgi:hypothetical protein